MAPINLIVFFLYMHINVYYIFFWKWMINFSRSILFFKSFALIYIWFNFPFFLILRAFRAKSFIVAISTHEASFFAFLNNGS